MDDLIKLADLLKAHNAIGRVIASLIGRPAGIGHIGEYIAAKIFNISLVGSASTKSIDGYFQDGMLAGRSVNVKWYTKQENLLDMTPDAFPDFYLVLTGPKSKAMSSRGTVRPLVIESVFLFESSVLVAALKTRNRKIGIATSVVQGHWKEAEVYPNQQNTQLILSDEQRQMLALFR
jgi:hypothetical protein